MVNQAGHESTTHYFKHFCWSQFSILILSKKLPQLTALEALEVKLSMQASFDQPLWRHSKYPGGSFGSWPRPTQSISPLDNGHFRALVPSVTHPWWRVENASPHPPATPPGGLPENKSGPCASNKTGRDDVADTAMTRSCQQENIIFKKYTYVYNFSSLFFNSIK